MGVLDYLALFCFLGAPALFPIYAAWVYTTDKNVRNKKENKNELG